MCEGRLETMEDFVPVSDAVQFVNENYHPLDVYTEAELLEDLSINELLIELLLRLSEMADERRG